MSESYEQFKPFSNLEPVWNGFHWSFVSKTTGIEYAPPKLVDSCVNDNVRSTWDKYFWYAVDASEYSMFSEFLVHWLEQIVFLNALYVAENAYQEYLSENTMPGNKNLGKVYKKADLVYNQTYNDYVNKYKDY